jgi:hypothetical protein
VGTFSSWKGPWSERPSSAEFVSASMSLASNGHLQTVGAPVHREVLFGEKPLIAGVVARVLHVGHYLIGHVAAVEDVRSALGDGGQGLRQVVLEERGAGFVGKLALHEVLVSGRGEELEPAFVFAHGLREALGDRKPPAGEPLGRRPALSSQPARGCRSAQGPRSYPLRFPAPRRSCGPCRPCRYRHPERRRP